jgi:hypothetical protein
MLHVETIVSSFKRRASHKKGWAAWAKEFPVENDMLLEACRLAEASDGQ